MSEPIFNFSNQNWKYKGVLSAIGDNEKLCAEGGWKMPLPKDFIVEIIAFVWIDENGKWKAKARLKFPSGNKQAFSLNLKGAKCVKDCVFEIKKFPMLEVHWFDNITEDLEGLIQTMKDNDLIESLKIIKVE